MRAANLVPVESGEADVDQHHVRPERIGRRERRDAVVGDMRIVALDLEQAGECIGRVPVVVDDEDPVPDVGLRLGPAIDDAAIDADEDRQVDAKLAATAGPIAADVDRAAVQLREVLGEGQPHAEPVLPVRSAAGEHVEDRGLGFRCDPDALVADADDDLASLAESREPDA